MMNSPMWCPLNTLQQSICLNVLSTIKLPLASQMTTIPTKRKVPQLSSAYWVCFGLLQRIVHEDAAAAHQISPPHFKTVESCQSTDLEPSTSTENPVQPDLSPPPPASSMSSEQTTYVHSL
jgi:hypothetical protein